MADETLMGEKHLNRGDDVDTNDHNIRELACVRGKARWKWHDPKSNYTFRTKNVVAAEVHFFHSRLHCVCRIFSYVNEMIKWEGIEYYFYLFSIFYYE